MKLRSLWVVLLAAPWLTGCPDRSDGVALLVEPAGPVLPLDHPAVPGAVTSRASNRLSVAQLAGSFAEVFGNDVNGNPIGWGYVGPNGPVDLLARFAPALGEPDYIVNTQENLEPSPMYVKLADDAARDACEKALLADADRPDPAQRVLLRHADTTTTDVSRLNENLRYLKLRFHGVRVSALDDAPITPLRTLWSQVAARGAPDAGPAGVGREAWKAVCVALATAPEFHLY